MTKSHPQHLLFPRSLPTWNSVIRASVEAGRFPESLFLYRSMRSAGLHGDNLTIPLVAKACAKLRCLRDGSQLHAHSIFIGCERDVFVQTSLVDMYSKCSALVDARRLFDAMPERSLVSWNCMISAYGRREAQVHTSFELLGQMRALGLKPNVSTFLGLLSGCGGSSAGWVLPQGSSLHCYGVKLGLDAEVCFSNALIGMYMKCGSVDAALALFESMEGRSAVSWTSVIGGYARVGDCASALKSFNEMRRCDDVGAVPADAVSYLHLISACASSGSSSQVGAAHALAVKSGCGGQSFMTIANSLLNSYSRCQDLPSAEKVFSWIPEKDVFSWTSMIAGYVKNGRPSQALSTFEKMLMSAEGAEPNEVTVATVLSACADLGALDVGQKIEDAYVKACGKLQYSDCRVQTALIHMYCRCGCVDRAAEIFRSARCRKDAAMWTCMISGYAAHGMGREALALYEEMTEELGKRTAAGGGGVVVDAPVFTGILSACGHSAGLIGRGLELFKSMREDFHVDPGLEHYLCLVDMLCRGGQLDLALEAIGRMPAQVQARVWSPFLSACRSHGDPHGWWSHLQQQSQKGCGLQPQSCGDYVLMAQTYASLGRWQDAAEVRRLMDARGLVKQPGWSRSAPANTQL